MKKIVLVDGVRTPFLRAGTGYFNQMAYELGAEAIRGLVLQSGIDPEEIKQVVMGTVISNLKTSNVARESMLPAGLPTHIPAHTVTMACISANRAISTVVSEMRSGQYDVAIAGGTESMSDTPITFRKAMQQKLFKAQKLKGFGDVLRFIFSLSYKDFLPERPQVAEYSTGRIMGEDCDIMAARFKVSREEQDEFAVRSHQLAAKAWETGWFDNQVVPTSFPKSFKTIAKDNGVRGDSTLEKVAKLRPAFDRKYGTLTAANSSFLTDGAAACLLMTEEKALALGYKPLAEIVDYVFTGQDLMTELLLGPAYATSHILERNTMDLSKIDVFEFHEAFAGQILSNLKALASNDFCTQYLGRDKAVGEIDMDKFNTKGGSLSIGHPFGATGARLLTTAARRLQEEDGEYALIAACAAGAHGHGCLLKRYQNN